VLRPKSRVGRVADSLDMQGCRSTFVPRMSGISIARCEDMRTHIPTLVIAGIFGAFASGCTVQGGAEYPVGEASVGVDANTGQVGGDTQVAGYVDGPAAFAAPPPLVEVDSDVSVVEDDDVPVYYSGGYYWNYRDDGWYRAQYWDSPWVSVDVGYVPGTLAHRDHHQDTHFHPNGSGQRVWQEAHVDHRQAGRAQPTRASTNQQVARQGDRRRPGNEVPSASRPVENRTPATPTRVEPQRAVERAPEASRPPEVTKAPETTRAPEPAREPERAMPERQAPPPAQAKPKNQAPPARRAPGKAAPSREPARR
jgi:hypothetical protein